MFNYPKSSFIERSGVTEHLHMLHRNKNNIRHYAYYILSAVFTSKSYLKSGITEEASNKIWIRVVATTAILN